MDGLVKCFTKRIKISKRTNITSRLARTWLLENEGIPEKYC